MLIARLDEGRSCREVGMQFFSGSERETVLKIEYSNDGETSHEAFFGASSGKTEDEERFFVTNDPIRYVLLTFYGNSVGFWNSINEIRFNP